MPMRLEMLQVLKTRPVLLFVVKKKQGTNEEDNFPSFPDNTTHIPKVLLYTFILLKCDTRA